MHGGDGVVAVQRREHEVAGERRLHGDAGGVGVSDLTDEDDVGVLPQEGLQSPVANVSPARSFVWTWLMPGNTYSTGSSMVVTFLPASC